jgi:hypothetical protein
MKQKADKYDRFAEWLRNEATDDQKDVIFLTQKAIIKQPRKRIIQFKDVIFLTQKAIIKHSRSRIIHFPASAGMK